MSRTLPPSAALVSGGLLRGLVPVLWMKVKVVLKRGKKAVARGSGKVGKRITLKGKKAKAGRYKVKLTFTQGTDKASVTKRIRVR